MAKSTNSRSPAMVEPRAIAEIRVAGFKSVRKEQSIEIRPLTILAGANSSGKSSMMQPLRIVAKIEINRHGVNRRFVVTHLSGDGQGIYHGFYV